MAKLVIAAVALVVMIGSNEANPVLSLLGNTGLNLDVLAPVLSVVENAVRGVAVTTIKKETNAGAEACTIAAARAVLQAKNNGATREQARELAIAAIWIDVRPVVQRVIEASAEASINNIYGQEAPVAAQRTSFLGRK